MNFLFVFGQMTNAVICAGVDSRIVFCNPIDGSFPGMGMLGALLYGFGIMTNPTRRPTVGHGLQPGTKSHHCCPIWLRIRSSSLYGLLDASPTLPSFPVDRLSPRLSPHNLVYRRLCFRVVAQHQRPISSAISSAVTFCYCRHCYCRHCHVLHIVISSHKSI